MERRTGGGRRRVDTTGRGARWCGSSAVLLVVCVAWADDAPIEEVVVTGSRISRPDFESASPIISITQEAFERGASSSVDTALNRMPQFVPYYTGTSNNPGNNGQANVQLRGLGAEATLVLMDGRRLVPADSTGVVDVNIVPASLVESAEIITGGASAVYGSDAIAGVVNFKLKRKFDGLQFDGRWGQTDRGDATQYELGVTAGTGFADGRGQVYGYAGYTRRDAVQMGARQYSKYALDYFGPDVGFIANGSTSITQGRPSLFPPNRESQAAFDTLLESYGYPPGTVPYQTTFGVNQDGTLFTQGNGRPGSVANYRGDQDPNLYNDRRYTYNYAPWNYLQLPLERTSLFGRTTFEFDDGVEVYGEALYADYKADQQLAPTPAFFLLVPVSNPYVPADLKYLLDSRPDASEPFWMAKRFDELGPRISSNRREAYQWTAGARVPVKDAWTIDAYVQYGKTTAREKQTGNTLRTKISELTFAPDGGASICGEFNLFGIDRISADCASYIAVSGTNYSGYDQTIVEVTATGPALSLPAGEVHLAIGGLYKDDHSYYRADPIAKTILDDGFEDIQGFNAGNDIDGSDRNLDLYVEALVPVLADLPGAERLEIGLGYRHSQYQSAGGTDAWKLDLLYQPAGPLRLRSSLQRAVRAPSVFELYSPLIPVVYGADDPVDPCSAGSSERSGPDAAQVERLCVAQGVPPSELPNYEDPDGIYLGVGGGNPDLKPESANTLTVGFVLHPESSEPWLSALQLSLDWYRMKVDDAIETVYATDYIPRCYDAKTNPNFELSNQWCQFFSRDPLNGQIDQLRDIMVNLDGYDVSGIDLQLDWSVPAGPGQVGVNALVSWLDYFKTDPPPGVSSEELAGYVGGYIGGSLPKWRLDVNLRYDLGGFGVGTEWQFVDSMLSRSTDWNYHVPSRSYLALYTAYEFAAGPLSGLRLRAGIENLTNEDPPLMPDSVAANTDPSQYDVLGRRYYLLMTYRY